MDQTPDLVVGASVGDAAGKVFGQDDLLSRLGHGLDRVQRLGGSDHPNDHGQHQHRHARAQHHEQQSLLRRADRLKRRPHLEVAPQISLGSIDRNGQHADGRVANDEIAHDAGRLL